MPYLYTSPDNNYYHCFFFFNFLFAFKNDPIEKEFSLNHVVYYKLTRNNKNEKSNKISFYKRNSEFGFSIYIYFGLGSLDFIQIAFFFCFFCVCANSATDFKIIALMFGA